MLRLYPMQLRLTNLGMPVEAPEESVRGVAAARLGVPESEVQNLRILRKSLDARPRDGLRFVYSLVVDLPDARPADLARIPGVEPYVIEPFDEPAVGSQGLSLRPIVIGSGPGGILAAYYLAKRGYRPLVLERGDPVKARVPAIRDFDRGGHLDAESNYLFGEGGAGTFSDGKLTCRMAGPDVDWVLRQFVDCGGKASICYEYRPHLGSNRLPMIVRNLRRKIEEWGGEYRFRCRAEGLALRDGQVIGVQTSSGTIPGSVVILAIGHSARDTYVRLFEQGVPMSAKAFQLGLRIEQPQSAVNQYRYPHERYVSLLGAADYSLTAPGSRDLFTFCMCAGGYIIPSVSEPGMFCTNGMSNSRHDSPYANSGLVVTLEPHEFAGPSANVHPLAGMRLQQRFEAVAYRLGRGSYQTPIQRVDDFLATRSPPDERIESSYARGSFPTSLDQVIPTSVARAIRAGLPIMDQTWRGAFLKDAVLVGPEMRGSSPIRIGRNPQNRQSEAIAGLYPVGEGAGYAGGIVSAAVDGLRTAKCIVRQFAPLENRG